MKRLKRGFEALNNTLKMSFLRKTDSRQPTGTEKWVPATPRGLPAEMQRLAGWKSGTGEPGAFPGGPLFLGSPAEIDIEERKPGFAGKGEKGAERQKEKDGRLAW